MATPGSILFSRGDVNSDFDEVWDDTALITAYDRAVNSAKEIIKQRRDTTSVSGNLSESSSNVENSQLNANRRRRRKNSSRGKNVKSEWVLAWQPGDQCRAVYSADGKAYEADVQSINLNNGTCVVQFVGYGNKEEVMLKHLQKSLGQFARQTQLEEARLCVEQETLDVNGVQHKGKQHGGKHFKHPNHEQFNSQRQNLPKAEKRRSSSGSSSNAQFFQNFSTANDQMPYFSQIPPLHFPPPLPFNEDSEDDDEALHSMLMAWYMSGYHTGYYQGLKCGRNKAKPTYCSSHASNQQSASCSHKCSKMHN